MSSEKLSRDLDFLKELDDGGLDVKYYVPNCNGIAKEMRIHNIYKEDRDFILKNDLILTLEQLPIGEYVIYIRHQKQKEDDEIMTLAKGRTCEETIKEVVNIYKNRNRNNDNAR